MLYRFRVIASYSSTLADFNLPHLCLAPWRGWFHSNFAVIFGIRKLESRAIMWLCLRDPTFSYFDTILKWLTHTYRQTHDNCIYHTSNASSSKNWSRFDRVTAMCSVSSLFETQYYHVFWLVTNSVYKLPKCSHIISLYPLISKPSMNRPTR